MPVNIPLRTNNPGKYGVVGKESNSGIFSQNFGTLSSSDAYSGFLFGRDDITGLGLEDELELLKDRLNQKIQELNTQGNSEEAQIYRAKLTALEDGTFQTSIDAIEANRNIIGDQLSYNPDFSSGSLKYVYSQGPFTAVEHDISGSVESENRNEGASNINTTSGRGFGVTINDQDGVQGNNSATVSLSQRYDISN